MEIVLNTAFNNPNLPIIPRPGFRDTFNRPEANMLRATDDEKTWQVHDPGTTSSVWGTHGDGTGGMKSSTSQHHLASVDALVPDGTLAGTLASYNGTDKRFGLAVRIIDAQTYAHVAPGSPSDPGLRIFQRIEGTTTLISSTTTQELEANDRLSVIVRGSDISAAVGGVEILSASLDPVFLTATRHGLYAFEGAVAAWEEITFEP